MECDVSSVLVIVDMQNDFVDGVLGSKQALKIIDPIFNLASSFKKQNNLVVFTQDTHSSDYLSTQEGKSLPIPHCIKDTNGHKIVQALEDLARSSKVYEKPCFASLNLAKDLEKLSSKIKQVHVVGLCTDICVISNAMLLRSVLLNSKIVVHSNLCAGVSHASHLNALDSMRACHIEII